MDIVPYIGISAGSNFQCLITSLGSMITKFPKVDTWILKINGEFNGRGFACFKVSSSKKLIKILMDSEGIEDNPRISKKLAEHIRE